MNDKRGIQFCNTLYRSVDKRDEYVFYKNSTCMVGTDTVYAFRFRSLCVESG